LKFNVYYGKNFDGYWEKRKVSEGYNQFIDFINIDLLDARLFVVGN
tara:strand:+ start:1393 stop:1530 length:138 start_codon:yes stop_codon:yes gene_type:complete